MKNKNILYKSIFLILMLFFSLTTGFAHSIDNIQDDEQKYPMNEIISYEKTFKIIDQANDYYPLPIDIPITDTLEDESNPDIVIDKDGNPIVLFDKNYDFSTNYIGISYSPSGGADWPYENYFEFGIEGSYMSNPKTTVLSDGIGCIGSYNDIISDLPDENFFKAQDITNPDTWEFLYWDNSGSSTYILETSSTATKEDILCFATISDYDNGEEYLIDCFSAHWHLHPDFDWIAGVYFYNTNDGISQPLSKLTADAGDKVFFVAEQEIVDGRKIIRTYYCEIDETTIYSDWSSSVVARVTGNCTNPDIYVSGPRAYCVYMNDENGNQDINIATSTSGRSWLKYTVANTADDELYPVVTANGDEVTCLFIKNNNVYVTKSTDAGKTWSEPIKVNDEEGTVPAAYGNLDVNAGSGTWTADINDNTDIFYEEVGKTPVITIDEISGGFGLSATISNVGTAAAEQIPWSIEFIGTMFTGSFVEGTIDIPVENSVTIQSGFILGFSQVDITITADDKIQSASAFVLGPLVILQ